jgi:hypothetical protein
MPRSFASIIVLLALLAGCRDPTDPGPPRFALSPTALPVVTAGTDSLRLTRTDDSTLALQLPEIASGPLTLTAHRAGRTLDLGQVTVAGFREKRMLAPGLARQVQLLPGAQANTVVGLDPTNPQGRTDLLSLDLATAWATAMPGLYASEFYGLAPGDQFNRIVAKDSLGVFGIWALWPAPTLIGPIPFPQGISGTWFS